MRFALLVLAVAALAQSQPPSSSPPGVAQTKQNKDSTKGNMPAPDQSKSQPPQFGLDKQDSAPNGENKKAFNGQSKETPSSDYTFLGANITDWLLALFTLFLAILGSLQWWAIKKQGIFMSEGLEETRKAALISQQNADAATGSLTLGQNAERAWMLFQAANLIRPLQVGQPILAEFIFKNTGKTPALGIRAAANFYIWEGRGESDPAPYFDPQFPRRDIGAEELWVGQANRRDESTHQIVVLLADELRDLIPSPTNNPPKKVLFFIGAVEYVDVFQLPINPSTNPHFSNFCAQFRIDASGGGMFLPAKCRIQIR